MIVLVLPSWCLRHLCVVCGFIELPAPQLEATPKLAMKHQATPCFDEETGAAGVLNQTGNIVSSKVYKEFDRPRNVPDVQGLCLDLQILFPTNHQHARWISSGGHKVRRSLLQPLRPLA